MHFFQPCIEICSQSQSFCLTWIIATYQSLNIAQWQVTLYTTKTWTLGLEFDKIYIGCNLILYRYHVHEPRIKFLYTKQLQEIKTKAPSQPHENEDNPNGSHVWARSNGTLNLVIHPSSKKSAATSQFFIHKILSLNNWTPPTIKKIKAPICEG